MIIIIDVVKKLPQITSQTSSKKILGGYKKIINKMGKTLQMKEQSIQKWMKKKRNWKESSENIIE